MLTRDAVRVRTVLRRSADMAVPYPPNGPVDDSQNKAHRVSVATWVIEAAFDDLPSGDTTSRQLAERLQLNLDLDGQRTQADLRT